MYEFEELIEHARAKYYEKWGKFPNYAYLPEGLIDPRMGKNLTYHGIEVTISRFVPKGSMIVGIREYKPIPFLPLDMPAR